MLEDGLICDLGCVACFAFLEERLAFGWQGGKRNGLLVFRREEHLTFQQCPSLQLEAVLPGYEKQGDCRSTNPLPDALTAHLRCGHPGGCGLSQKVVVDAVDKRLPACLDDIAGDPDGVP